MAYTPIIQNMHPHKKLLAYTLSFEFVAIAYRTTEFFPKEERFGLTSQIRRAAVSVPVNIAEGAARRSKKEFVRFLHYSSGSVTELDTLILLSLRLGFIENGQAIELIKKLDEIGKLISGLTRKIESQITD